MNDVSGDTWEQNRNKARLTVTLPRQLKEEIKSELKYSSLNMSDLVREAFREFLSEEVNSDSVYDEVEEIECSECGGVFTSASLEKTDGECLGCESEVEV